VLQALRKAAQLAKSGATAVHAYRLLAQMKQGLGDHLGAVRELNRGITATDKEAQRIELRFLRGEWGMGVGGRKAAWFALIRWFCAAGSPRHLAAPSALPQHASTHLAP
jgi:hypothetical protein